jgi:hypothetical protein
MNVQMLGNKQLIQGFLDILNFAQVPMNIFLFEHCCNMKIYIVKIEKYLLFPTSVFSAILEAEAELRQINTTASSWSSRKLSSED